ncbi:MAG: DNA primase DnaG [Candidatus Thorarchaeota archaeon]
MGTKNDTSTTKYEIRALFEIDGVVEKPDIIGGLYGQLDGLLSENLDIRELQKTGRIGRINVELSSSKGKTKGKIIIPSSLQRMETAILAAAVETVDRVGPCSCKIQLEEIVDIRIKKRQSIVDRASEIIREWDQNVSPFSSSVSLEVEKPSKISQIMNIGKEGFSAGQGFEKEKKIILVEGRADVVNLLKYGIDNTIAVDGTSISPKLVDLIKKKTVTAFLDGDRGGDLILKELLQVAHVEYVARAPEGKEVEELNEKEAKKALDEVVSLEKAVFLTGVDKGLTVKEFNEKAKPQKKKKLGILKPRKEPEIKEKEEVKPTKELEKRKPTPTSTPKPSTPSRSYTPKPKPQKPVQRQPSTKVIPRSSSVTSRKPSTRRSTQRPPRREIRKVQLPEYLTKTVSDIKTKLEVVVFDDDEKEILRSTTANIYDELDKIEKANTIVIDGVITQRLLEKAYSKGIKTVIGARKGEISKKPTNVKIIEFKNI